MTPKQKAADIVEEYQRNIEGIHKTNAQICTLIAIDITLDFMDKFDLDLDMEHQYNWYKQVKQEIENL
jgi:hypothetical protein